MVRSPASPKRGAPGGRTLATSRAWTLKELSAIAGVPPEVVKTWEDRGYLGTPSEEKNAAGEAIYGFGQAERCVEIAVEGDPTPAEEFLRHAPWARDVAQCGDAIHLSIRDPVLALSEIPRAMLDAGFRLTRFTEREVDLEEAFLQLTKGKVA